MSDVNPVEFGRVLGHLESIQSELRELTKRTVWRLDNLEARVEKLESRQPTIEGWGQWIERAVLALVAIGAGILGAHI